MSFINKIRISSIKTWSYNKSPKPYELAFDNYDNFLRGLPLLADDHSFSRRIAPAMCWNYV